MVYAKRRTKSLTTLVAVEGLKFTPTQMAVLRQAAERRHTTVPTLIKEIVEVECITLRTRSAVEAHNQHVVRGSLYGSSLADAYLEE